MSLILVSCLSECPILYTKSLRQGCIDEYLTSIIIINTIKLESGEKEQGSLGDYWIG